MQKVICHACGITYLVEEDLFISWQKTGRAYYCMNGHASRFPIEDFAFKDQLDKANNQIASLNLKIKELETELELWKPTQSML